MSVQSAQNTAVPAASTGRRRVVIVGSGFGGISAAQALADANVDITLVSKTDTFLFVPMLYQVATGLITENEVAPSIGEVLKGQDNVTIVQAEVTDIDLEGKAVIATANGAEQRFAYDEVVFAAGAGQSYFGNDHFAEFAPGMKTVEDALYLRSLIFDSFDRAEKAAAEGRMDDARKALTFVVVGAGPTGLELVGQLAEICNRTLADRYQHIDTREARLVLVEGMGQVMPPFSQKLGASAQRQLEDLGVEVRLNSMATDITAEGITLSVKDQEPETIEADTKIWAAGVQCAGIGKVVADKAGAETDRAGRVVVQDDLTLPGHPEIFFVGDMIKFDGAPGVAQNAMQSGKHAGETIARRTVGLDSTEPYSYFDKGSFAVIARGKAVGYLGADKKVELTRVPAWLMWMGIHLAYLPGLRNRALSLKAWVTDALGAPSPEVKEITSHQAPTRNLGRPQA
ncbi:NAD(P)/FAD-dependent oxidoreductase [Kytococcus schroeteri]|uniref:NAD(P)/FAD-dependent oxidoreductase n=1 Tax=Kytococcus schroeteri TaxID=138300 RepID=UPI0015E883F6|nr:NAD(P)/FAD-dependent oxidoreductase [Kytococcus schroeteri]